MLSKLIPLATIAVFGVAGSTFAQEAAQSNSAAGNADVPEAMTCADLNEMEPELAIAFLSGYRYALTAGDRASAAGAQSGSGAASSEPSTASSEPSTASSQPSTASSQPSTASSEAAASGGEVGPAATTGDVARTGAADNGVKAILAGCFDAPSTSLDEVLSGAFGELD
jgi:hypothetical protein